MWRLSDRGGDSARKMCSVSGIKSKANETSRAELATRPQLAGILSLAGLAILCLVIWMLIEGQVLSAAGPPGFWLASALLVAGAGCGVLACAAGGWLGARLRGGKNRADLVAELRGREQFLDTVLDTTPECIKLLRPDGTLLRMNRKGLEMVGLDSVDQVQGRSMADLVVPEDRQAFLALHADVMSGSPGFLEFEIVAMDGARRRVETSAVPLCDASGSVIAHLGVTRDLTDRVAREDAERRIKFQARLLDVVGEAVIAMNADDVITYWNASAEALYGWRSEEVVGRDVLEVISSLGTPDAGSRILREVRETGHWNGEFSSRRQDGSEFVSAVTLSVLRGGDGAVEGIVGVSSDITARKCAEQALAESETRLRRIIETVDEPILVVDAGGNVAYTNPAAERLLGRSSEQLLGESLGLPLVSPGAIENVELTQPDGTVRYTEMRVVESGAGADSRFVVSLHDLTERHAYESRIEHLANHDALTGLPNRNLLNDRANQAIAHARRVGKTLALVYLDLDGFKFVNDSFGHPLGDKLLEEASSRVLAVVRPDDTVARLGGDEFVVLLPYLERGEDVVTVVDRIFTALSAPFQIGDRELYVSASAGVSVYPDDGLELETLLKNADAAMYRAKEAGRNSYHFYSAEIGAQTRERVDIETALHHALARNELWLAYQPQLDLGAQAPRCFEALLRWKRDGEVVFAPDRFIPVAEETGLIAPIGEWVLRTACRQVAAWRRQGCPDLQVAVNVSARQFWQGNVAGLIADVLAESALPGQALEIEITERVVLRDTAETARVLNELRALGVSIAIDDFGTGYSSLGYLRELPIDKLKIDKSFIAGMVSDAQAAALVRHIIQLAQVLGLRVCAEGVEAVDEEELLRQAGCDAIQGYLYAKPMPADECKRLLVADTINTAAGDGRNG